MPLFAPETVVGKVVRAELESSTYGPQVVIEYETPDPESGNRFVWLRASDREGNLTKISARSVTAWWLTQAAQFDGWIDGLDFRTVAATEKSLQTFCKKITDQWYLLENKLPEIRFSGDFQVKEKLVPVKKFRTEEEALAAWVAENEGGEAPSATVPAVSDEVVNVALPFYKEAARTGGVPQGEATIRMLAESMWKGVDVDALVAELKKQTA